MQTPRGKDGRAPDVVPRRRLDADARVCRRRGGRFRHRRHRRRRRHARLPARRSRLFRRRASTPAPGGGRSRISRPTKRHQQNSTGPTSGSATATNPLQLGANNSGKAVGGSTVHFAMVSLRFRPEWFKARSLLGYGADWPLDWREMWRYYARGRAGAEDLRAGQLSVGPKRPRYPYRPHELNAAALVLARGLPRRWVSPGRRRRSPRSRRRAGCRTPASIAASASSAARPTPSRARSSPGSRARSPPAPRSATSRWSAASRPIDDGRVTGVHYLPRGRWRFQRARNVVVAGYAIETPRLLLNSADRALSGRARQQLGLVGKNLMVQANQAVCGHDGGGDPLVQGAALARDHRALELRGQRQGFLRRLLLT